MDVQKQCADCGESYPEQVFFRRAHAALNASSARRYHPICIGCEQTARDEMKRQEGRWNLKARDTLRRHTKKFIRLGIATNMAEFVEQFGWNVERIARDFQRAYESRCGYCDRPFGDMGHGLSDITLDIVNPDEPPFYTTNTRLVCQTCNRQKGCTPPHLWAQKLLCWAKWKVRQAQLRTTPWMNLPLFGKFFSSNA